MWCRWWQYFAELDSFLFHTVIPQEEVTLFVPVGWTAPEGLIHVVASFSTHESVGDISTIAKCGPCNGVSLNLGRAQLSLSRVSWVVCVGTLEEFGASKLVLSGSSVFDLYESTSMLGARQLGFIRRRVESCL